MVDAVINIIIAIIIFGVLVVFHEFGHFIAAKKCGVIVNEFSVGMGPRLFSVTKGGTKYSLKAVPFGGSCAMLGEDQDTIVEGSFNSKPVWKRMIIVFAGPFFNFILAWVAAIIMVLAMGAGASYVTNIDEESPAYAAGIRNGDHIISVNGHSSELVEEMQYNQLFYPLSESACTVKYKRDGKVNTVKFDAKAKKAYRMGFNYGGEEDEGPCEIGQINLDSPIYHAGGKAGDIIVEVNGTKIESSKQFYEYVENDPFDGSEIKLVVERKGEQIELNIKPVVTTAYTMGFGVGSDGNGDGKADKPSNVYEVAKYSFHNVKSKVNVVFQSLKMLLTGEAGVDDMQGPVGIVATMGDTLETESEHPVRDKISAILFWIVFLSTNLGVMNLLPLPALDGGRLFINIIEVIMRKPVNRTFEGVYHFVGFCILMALMVLLVVKDVGSLI